MRRRDFVKGIVAVPVAAKAMLGQQTTAPPPTSGMGPPSQVPSTSGLQQAAEASAPPPATLAEQPGQLMQSLAFNGSANNWAVPDAVAETETHFFNDEQLAAFRKLCEIMVPPLNGYPGATQAGAPEFIDFLIGASPADQQELYRSGLDRLNKEAKKQFGVPFAEVNATQADTLLRPFLASWMTDHPPTEPFVRFINVAHHDIRTATMNSQVWSLAASATGERAPGVGLYWAPIDPDLDMYV